MPARILIVDDNVYLLQLLQGMLEDEGLEVETATYAAKGYDAYLSNRPDVILTDIHMPGGSGLEMVARISRQDPYVRAVYMSGDWAGLQTVMEEEKRKSFVKPLRKPFYRDELMKVLSAALSPDGGRQAMPFPGRQMDFFKPLEFHSPPSPTGI